MSLIFMVLYEEWTLHDSEENLDAVVSLHGVKYCSSRQSRCCQISFIFWKLGFQFFSKSKNYFLVMVEAFVFKSIDILCMKWGIYQVSQTPRLLLMVSTIFSPSLCRSLSLSLTLSLLECRGQEPRGVCVELIPKLVALEGVGGWIIWLFWVNQLGVAALRLLRWLSWLGWAYLLHLWCINSQMQTSIVSFHF